MSAGADEGRPGRGRVRDERAERLARLRGATAEARLRGATAETPEADDPAALAAFLQVLRAAIADDPADAACAAAPVFAPAAEVLPFQRASDRAADRGERPPGRPRDPSPPGDLDRLPGAGPGLVWALERAGIAGLADLAASAPGPLADRLGPIGALIDLPAWIAFARTASGPAGRPETDAPPA